MGISERHGICVNRVHLNSDTPIIKFLRNAAKNEQNYFPLPLPTHLTTAVQKPQLGLIQSLPLHAGFGGSLVIASQSYHYSSQNSLSASLKNRLSIMSFTRQMKIVPAVVRKKIKMGYRSHKIKGFSVT